MPGNREFESFDDLTEFTPPTEEVGELVIEDRLTCESFGVTLQQLRNGVDPDDETLATLVAHMVTCPGCLSAFNQFGAEFLGDEVEGQ